MVLLGISILSVYSATLNAVTAFGTPLSVLFPRHLINIAVGVAAMVGASLVNYRQLTAFAVPIYMLALLALGFVLVGGTVSEGAQSWVSIGTRTIQPSEIAKLFIIIVLAAYWERFRESSSTWRVQAGSLALVGAPMLLVALQPDLGTTIVIGCIWLAMAWGAGIRVPQLAVLAVLAVPVVSIGWQAVLDEEQKSRLLTFYVLLTNPDQVDPNDGYNVIQSLNAISSGGLLGTGLLTGLLSQGNYIPVQYTDFIFAVIGEELGFVGGTVLLVFQGMLLWLILSIADEAGDLFGRLIAFGIFGMFLCHILINAGMAMSVLPVTGLPMPFISYGGSFTITTLLAIGLLQSIRLHRRRLAFS